jgi:hypothetical protein
MYLCAPYIVVTCTILSILMAQYTYDYDFVSYKPHSNRVIVGQRLNLNESKYVLHSGRGRVFCTVHFTHQDNDYLVYSVRIF